ncbi:MAG: ATP-dependent Clp protease proteolytic subunit [Ferruginibacter sp.]
MFIKNKAINPIIYEKTANGEEIHDIFSRLLKERILFIGEEITSDLANCVVSQLLWLDKQSQEEAINIYINSPGGEITSMFAIYDIMQYIKAPIYTFVIGSAASAAAVLLAAGTNGYRFALPSSEIMIHQPWAAGLQGQISEIAISTKQLQRDKKKMLTILARHTGKTYEQIEKDCDRDFYLDPQTAIKYGIIDKITAPSKELPPINRDSNLKKPNLKKTNKKK